LCPGIRGRAHVLQVVTHLDLGGAEQVALSLTEGLADHADFSFFAVMGAGGGVVAEDMAMRLEAIGSEWLAGTSLPFKRGGLVEAGIRLARLIERTQPDLVHLHTELPEACWAVASLLSQHVRETPVLRTIHNTRLWPAWGMIGRWAERRLGDRRAVAVSQGALEGLKTLRHAAGLAPLPALGAEVVYNGVVSPTRSMRSVAPDAPIRVLFAGRLEEQKGADLLPAIWVRARARASRAAHLTVLGDGSLKAKLDASARNDESIEIEGPVSRLADRLADYDLLLMPSRFEGLPLVAVEAFMAGLGFVGFDAPGLSEVVPTSHPTLPPVADVDAIADMLARAINDPDGFRSDETTRHVQERFGMKRMLDAYGTLYRSLGFNLNKINSTVSQNNMA
jgi:glycosyltransferase involved in cell wall biosynthesis